MALWQRIRLSEPKKRHSAPIGYFLRPAIMVATTERRRVLRALGRIGNLISAVLAYSRRPKQNSKSLQNDRQVPGQSIVFNVIKIVFEFPLGIVLARAIGIINLRPSSKAGLESMS